MTTQISGTTGVSQVQDGVVSDSKLTLTANSAPIKTALNASGATPVYACRAWVNFNGTGTIAMRASGNVSSVSDGGVGIYTINFANAMQDTNYCAVSMSGAGGSANATLGGGNNTTLDLLYLTGSIRVMCLDASDATFQDTAYANVAIFR
jgi:hypothetical protein